MNELTYKMKTNMATVMTHLGYYRDALNILMSNFKILPNDINNNI